MTDKNAPPAPAPPVITGNIRAEMARAGMSVQRAQNIVNVSPGTWETRMKTPGTWRMNELERLAAALGVSVARLVVGE